MAMKIRFNGLALALLAVALAALAVLGISFLPFFMGEVWGPLWGVEWQPEGVSRSFGRVGPLCGVSQWPALLAIPVASALVLSFLVLSVGLALILWRRNGLRLR